MNCRRTINALMDYQDRRLRTDRRTALESHLAMCPRCVEFLHAYRAVSQIVRRVTEMELPSGVQSRLRARLGP